MPPNKENLIAAIEHHKEEVIDTVCKRLQKLSSSHYEMIDYERHSEREENFLNALLQGLRDETPESFLTFVERLSEQRSDEGYTLEEMFACVVGARLGLSEVWRGWQQMGQTFRERNVSRSFNVLTRALRAKHPGLVFARAAANEAMDPLTDVESRLLVGLPVQ